MEVCEVLASGCLIHGFISAAHDGNEEIQEQNIHHHKEHDEYKHREVCVHIHPERVRAERLKQSADKKPRAPARHRWDIVTGVRAQITAQLLSLRLDGSANKAAESDKKDYPNEAKLENINHHAADKYYQWPDPVIHREDAQQTNPERKER
jgi:hypothetical protein